MKILLLTDMPPCANFTAGLVLDRLVRLLPPEDIVICSIVNPAIKPEVPRDISCIPSLNLKKPRESAVRMLPFMGGSITAYIFELLQSIRTSKLLLPQVIEFAKKNKVEVLWVVLQGQTIIRLARPLAHALKIPMITQVWDPLGWWLRDNRIDNLTQRRLLAEFDRIIQSSKACATASWAMSEGYTQKYGVHNLPIISNLPRELAREPATEPHAGDEFIISIAGQFYAQAEWNSLILALNYANWVIAGRRVRIRIMGSEFRAATKAPANFEYLGWQNQVETIRLLAESDLLYLPYWFSEEFREESTNGFPAKLVNYFAAGRPVFCHAPDYASPAKYIAQHDAGFRCESLDPSYILKTLEDSITDSALYARFAQNGSNCFLHDFTLERMEETFFHLMRI